MKRVALTGALLAALASSAWAQEPATTPETPDGAPAPVAFVVEVDAPDEIRSLLEKHLDLQRYRTLTDLSDGELSRLVDFAGKNTRDLVATRGYFSPTIKIEQHPATEISPRRVALHVQLNAPTLVSETEIGFAGAIAKDVAAQQQRTQINQGWTLRPGMRFTQADWDSAKQKALRQLTTLRYPTGRVGLSLADIDPESHKASLSITLDSGPAYRLGALRVTGTRHHDVELVTRLARLRLGSDYEQARLVEAQQRLSDSGFFDSAYVSLDTSGDPNAAPVLVQVREAPLQKLVLGIGASTDAGPRLSVEHTHHKVPGLGWRAVSKLLLDGDTQSIGSELTAPPDEDNWRWVTSALWQHQRSGSFDVSSQRLRAGRSQREARIDRNYYLQFDRAQTAASDTTAITTASSLSANYAFTLRNFDGLPFPTDGWGLNAELGGGTTLGSRNDPYGRFLLRWLGYYPLSRGKETLDLRAGRIALRLEAGAVIARDGITLPSTQLFLTGGDNAVRGYSHRNIGVTLADGQITAGRYLTTGSVEWQRPITVDGRLTDWEGTLFVDAGAVADKPSDLRLKVGIGAGVRLKSPVGPLQIDVAYGLDVKRFRLHLNVGFTF